MDFDKETLMLTALAGGAFLVMRYVFSHSDEEGELDDVVATAHHAEYAGVTVNPADILRLNPRFATEPLADREYAIRKLGGKPVNPTKYPYTLDGFQSYLDAVGVNSDWASALELAKINHPDVGRRYGYTLFLPPHVWWPKAAALALLQNKIRALVGQGVIISNWWRPAGYNEAVGGAKRGDHPDGDALDLYFSSNAAKWKACRYVYALQQSEPQLAVSLGIYGNNGVLHVGLQSARGRRTWDYTNGKGTGARITQAKIDTGLRNAGVA